MPIKKKPPISIWNLLILLSIFLVTGCAPLSPYEYAERVQEHYYAAFSYYENGQYLEAEKDATKAINGIKTALRRPKQREGQRKKRARNKLNESLSDLYGLRALIRHKLNKLDKGLEDANTALALNDDNDRAHLAIGLIYLEKNDLDIAEGQLDRYYHDKSLKNILSDEYANKTWNQLASFLYKGMDGWLETIAEMDGREIFEDNFSDNKNGWAEFDESTYKMSVSGKGYYLQHKKETGAIKSDFPIKLNHDQDFKIAITLRKTYGQDSQPYGILWGFRDWDNHYGFFINGYGSYTYSKTESGKEKEIVPWDRISSINKSSATNKITVEKEGSQLFLSVNNERILEEKFLQPFDNRICFFVQQVSVKVLNVVVQGTFL